MTETVGWLIRVHWHVQYISGVVGGEDAGNRTGQGAPTVCACVCVCVCTPVHARARVCVCMCV